MSHMKFQVEVLEKFCKDAFQKFGFSEEEINDRLQAIPWLAFLLC